MRSTTSVVHATGAPGPAGGYIIQANGLINPRDASGAVLKKPFHVKSAWRLDEVAEHLEAHIAKHSGELQLSAAQACRPFSMCLACWQICSCACALLPSPPFACALVISGNDDGVAGSGGDGAVAADVYTNDMRESMARDFPSQPAPSPLDSPACCCMRGRLSRMRSALSRRSAV